MNKMNPKAINVYVLKYWDDEDNRWEIDKVTSNIEEALKWDSRGNDYCYNGYSVEVEELEQLTKAKELLTRFVMASVYFNGKETDLVEEAEQFLKEIEK